MSRKSKAIAVHVTAEENNRLVEAASVADISKSELIREATNMLVDAILEHEAKRQARAEKRRQ